MAVGLHLELVCHVIQLPAGGQEGVRRGSGGGPEGVRKGSGGGSEGDSEKCARHHPIPAQVRE
eukprot:217879-Prorocentrum_minimum.AAC.1